MPIKRVVTYFLDLIAGPYGLAFRGGDLVSFLDGGRLVILGIVVVVAGGVLVVVVAVREVLVAHRVAVGDVRRVHPRVLRVSFQGERSGTGYVTVRGMGNHETSPGNVATGSVTARSFAPSGTSPEWRTVASWSRGKTSNERPPKLFRD